MVIGLQSTGEARTLDVVAERAVDGELDDFVSGPKVTDQSCRRRVLLWPPECVSAITQILRRGGILGST